MQVQMDIAYYKTIQCYIDVLTKKEDVKISDLEKIIDKCPLEYIQPYILKEYRLNYNKNLPNVIVENKSHTTLAIGICYFLAKSNFMYADSLIMPLITYINSKIEPRIYNDPRNSSAYQEKSYVERTHWHNFSIISATIFSYAFHLGPNDPNFNTITKSLFFFWMRILKSILKIISNTRSSLAKSKNLEDKQGLKSQVSTGLGSWYCMALSHVSIGIMMALDPENLSAFILNPEKYYDFIPKSHLFDLDIPDSVIKEVRFLYLSNLN